jgi:hypothetical protein
MELTINLQDIDAVLAEELRQEAKRHNMSLDAFILQLLYYGLTAWRRKDQLKTYHDLDDLAGTWTTEEAASFEAVMADFETVDESLWS